MKINKLILKISHFFGLRLDEEHQDDITINIPTIYPETAWNNIWLNHDCSSKESKWVMDDILKQVYDKLEQDTKLEKRCRNVGKVLTTFYTTGKDGRYNFQEGSIVLTIPYVEGELWNICEKGTYDAWERHVKLKQLLND